MIGNLKSNIILFISFVVMQIVMAGLTDFGPLYYLSVYPLFLITMPVDTHINKLLVWAFLTGLTIDYFSNYIMGINSAASVMMVAMQPRIFRLIYRKGDLENQIRPGMKEMGFSRFTYYMISCLAVFHITFSLAESFGMMHFVYNLPRTLVSLTANSILILIIEYGMFYKRSR